MEKSFLYTWNVLHWLHTISHLLLHVCYIVNSIVHFIWMRGWVKNYPHSVYGIYRYQFKKVKHYFSTWSPCFPIPPPQQAFLSSHKIQFIYFPIYISFSRIVPITYTSCSSWQCRLLCRLWIPLEAPDFQLFWFMLIRRTHVFICSCSRVLYQHLWFTYISNCRMISVPRDYLHPSSTAILI